MLEDGYQTGKVTLSPETLTVEGPESLIGQISSVGIEINLDGKNADWSDSEEPKFYDANKNSITISDRLISNCQECRLYHGDSESEESEPGFRCHR